MHRSWPTEETVCSALADYSICVTREAKISPCVHAAFTLPHVPTYSFVLIERGVCKCGFTAAQLVVVRVKPKGLQWINFSEHDTMSYFLISVLCEDLWMSYFFHVQITFNLIRTLVSCCIHTLTLGLCVNTEIDHSRIARRFLRQHRECQMQGKMFSFLF